MKKGGWNLSHVSYKIGHLKVSSISVPYFSYRYIANCHTTRYLLHYSSLPKDNYHKTVNNGSMNVISRNDKKEEKRKGKSTMGRFRNQILFGNFYNFICPQITWSLVFMETKKNLNLKCNFQKNPILKMKKFKEIFDFGLVTSCSHMI